MLISLPSLKSKRQLRFTQQIVLAPGLAEGQNLKPHLFSGTKNIFRLYSGICKDKYPM